MEYIIDISKYGITEGFLGNAPYTVAQYAIAKKNIDGIQEALNYAKENKYNKVMLPKGSYSLCYLGTDDIYRQTNLIKVPSGIIFDLGGSSIEIIYDSDNKSPYAKKESVTNAFDLGGTVFVFQDTMNSGIQNGELIGDIYKRSFSNTNEKAKESTTGIKVFSRAYYTTIKNMRIHGFMADGITGTTRAYDVFTIVTGYGDSLPGYMNDDGTVTTSNAANSRYNKMYYSPLMAINRVLLAATNPNYPNSIQLQTGGGYVRIPSFGMNNFEALLYKADGVFSRRITLDYLGIIYLLKDEIGIRLQFFEEKAGLATLPRPNLPQSYLFTDIASSYCSVCNCDIYNHHRGGISNMPDFTTIDSNQIYHNGLDSGINAPLFPDSTRYQINCEDTYSRQVTITNNLFHSGFNGVLLSTDNVLVSNNVFSNMRTAVIVYNTQKVIIENNRIQGCIGLSLSAKTDTTTIGGIKRYVVFKNNRISTNTVDALSIPESVDKPNINIEGNYIECISILIGLNRNVHLTNNTIILSGTTKYYQGILIKGCGRFYNNKVIGNMLTVTGERSFFDAEFSDNNYFKEVRCSMIPISDLNKLDNAITIPAGVYEDSDIDLWVSVTGTYLINYSNSKFKNTTTSAISSINLIEGLITTANFKNCEFIIKSNPAIYSFGTEDNPNINLEKCSVVYKEDNIKPPLIRPTNAAYVASYNIKLDNVTAEGVDDLREHLTSGGIQ